MFVSGIYDNQLQDLLNTANEVTVSGGEPLGELIGREITEITNEMWALYLAQWFYASALRYFLRTKKDLSEIAIKKYNKVIKGLAKKIGVPPSTIEATMLSTNDIMEIIPHFKHFENVVKTHNATELYAVNLWSAYPTDNVRYVLRDIEQKVIAKLKDKIPFKSLSQYKVLKEYDNDFVWIDLETTKCDIEARATGHCGTTSYGDSTLLSLRKIHKERGQLYFTSHVTVELGKKGNIIQCKGTKREGQSNLPIALEFREYVLDLIINYKEIKGLKPNTNMYRGLNEEELSAICDNLECFNYLLESRDNFNFVAFFNNLRFATDIEEERYKQIVINKYPVDNIDLKTITEDIYVELESMFSDIEDEEAEEVVTNFIPSGLEAEVRDVGERYDRQIIVGISIDYWVSINEDKVLKEVFIYKDITEQKVDALLEYKGVSLEEYVEKERNSKFEWDMDDSFISQLYEIHSDWKIVLSPNYGGDIIYVGYALSDIWEYITLIPDKTEKIILKHIKENYNDFLIKFMTSEFGEVYYEDFTREYAENLFEILKEDYKLINKIFSIDKRFLENLKVLEDIKANFGEESLASEIAFRLSEEIYENQSEF